MHLYSSAYITGTRMQESIGKMHFVSRCLREGRVSFFVKSVVLNGAHAQVLHAELEDLLSKLTEYRETMLRGSVGSQVKLPVSRALVA